MKYKKLDQFKRHNRILASNVCPNIIIFSNLKMFSLFNVVGSKFDCHGCSTVQWLWSLPSWQMYEFL